MTANLKLVKLAVKRDNSVPMGHPAPVHLDCPCGSKVQIVSNYQTCIQCGNVYTESGWLQESK